MSRAATDWAWKQDLKPSLKLVLLSMADRAGEEHECWPAVSRLSKDTGLNSKTIRTALKQLVDLKIIADTGQRKGRTKQITVYQLVGLKVSENDSLKGTQKEQPLSQKVPKSGHLKGTQKRVTEPVIKNQRSKKKTNKEKFDPKSFPIPPWLSHQSWCAWIDHLKTKRKSITEIQAPRLISKLTRYREQGHDPNAAIEHSIANGYQGVFPDDTTTKRNKPVGRIECPTDRVVRRIKENEQRVRDADLQKDGASMVRDDSGVWESF